MLTSRRAFASLGAGVSGTVGTLLSATHPVFDVTHPDYGAKFDGTTDDTTAINNAITAAFNEGGGTVLMPPGIGMVSQLRMKSNVALIGSGQWPTRLRQIAGTGAHGIILDSATLTERVRCENFIWEGQAATQGGVGDGIRFDNTGFSNSGPSGATNPMHMIRNVHIRDCADNGLSMIGPFSESRLENIFVHDCDQYGYFIDSPDNLFNLCTTGQSGEYGFRVVDANNVFASCKAWFCGRLTAGNGDGFALGSASARNRYIGCEAQDCNAHGFNIFQSHDNVFSGCIVDSCGGQEGVDSGVTNASAFRIDAAHRNVIVGCRGFNRGAFTTMDWVINLLNTPNDNLIVVQSGAINSGPYTGTIGTNSLMIVPSSGTGAFAMPADLNVGFYGVTPVARPAAYTQTYATATRSHALGAASEAHALAAVFSDTEVEAALNALGARINECKNLINQIIDDDQSQGLKQ